MATGLDPAETIKFRLPGTATAGENEFTQALATRLQAADAATSGAAYLLIGSEHTFSFDENFAGTLTITWVSVDDGVAEGNQVAGLEIYGQSTGSLTASVATATLVDTGEVQAPQVLLSLSVHDEGLPAGDLVGLLSVFNGIGPAYDTYSLSDTAGGRYAIDGVDNHRLELGATVTTAGISVISGTATNGVTPLTFTFNITALPVATGDDTEIGADSFDRPNENLDVSVLWEFVAGTSAKITVTNNEVRLSTGTDTYITTASLDSINHYAQGPLAALVNKAGFIDVRIVDANNLVGVRYVTSPSSVFEIWTRIAGTFTLGATLAATPIIGDMVRVEARDNLITVKLAGTTIGTYTLTTGEMDILDNGTKIGLSNSVGTGQFLQSMSWGTLGPIVPPEPLILLSANQVSENSLQGSVDIGTFSIVNGFGTYDITLTDSAGSRFQVAGAHGMTLQPGTVPTDFEISSSHVITASASNGVDTPSTAQFTISVLDVFEAPPTTQPLDPNAFYLTQNSVGGTVVGLLTLPGQTITGRSITLQRTYRNFNSPYTAAIFSISGTNLIVGSGNTATFMGGLFTGTTGTLYSPSMLPWYEVTVDFTLASGGPVTKVYKIRPRMAHVNPTGDTTGNVYTVNTLSMNTAVNETTKTGGLRFMLDSNTSSGQQSNRTIVISPSLIGTHEVNSNSYTDLISGNLTITGHRRSIQFRDFAPRIYGATNVIFRDMIFRAGGDTTGRDISNDRDSMQLTSGQNILFENCDFSWAYDECVSSGWNSQQPAISPKPTMTNLRFYRCFFYASGEAPCHNESGEEVSHPYGVLLNDYTSNIVGHKNVMLGFRQRSPISYRNYGSLWQNNVLIYGTNSGTGWTKHENAGSPSYATYIHRNNLMRPAFQTAAARAFAYASWRSIAGDMEVHEYGNHFIGDANTGNYSSFAFAADLITPSANYKANSGSTSGIFVPYMPFLPAPELDADLMPTDTAAQREALFDDVTLKAGCRTRDGSGVIVSGTSAMSKIGAWYMSNFLTGTNAALTPTGTNKYNEATNTRCGGENTGSFNVIPIRPSAGGIARINFPNDLVSAGFASGGWDTGLPP